MYLGLITSEPITAPADNRSARYDDIHHTHQESVMRFVPCSLLSALILFLPTISPSQWIQESGPFGGPVNAVAVNPTATGGPVVFAGTQGGGNFRSTDNGATWTAVSSGLMFIGTYAGANAFAAKGTDIFATTVSGIFLSTDNGTNWTSVNGSDATGILVNGNDIYAGTAGGALHSTGSGSSWTRIDSGLGSVQVNTFVVNGGTLFSGTEGSGIFQSTNNGGHWYPADTGLTNTTVRSLVLKGTTLLAGTLGGIFRSTDNGAHWAMTDPSVTTSLLIDGSNLFASGFGILKSTDDGLSWAAADTGVKEVLVNSLAINGGTIFAGAATYPAGVYISTDHGVTWSKSDHGVIGTQILSLAYHSNGSGGYDLYAGTNENGVYRSTDNGTSWNPMNNGLANFPVNALAFSGGILFAGVFQEAQISTNNGGSWMSMSNGIPSGSTIKQFAVKGSMVFAATDQGVFLTTDTGATWNLKGTGMTSSEMNTIAYSGSDLYAGGSGMYFSTNDGSSWTPIGAGLAGATVTSVAFIGTDLIAGTTNGIYRSTDNGTSWNPGNTGLSNTSINNLVTVDSGLVAGTVFGLYYSSNRGASWAPISTGMPTFLSIFWPYIQSLAAVPNGSGGTDLLAGTFLMGVWRRSYSQITDVRGSFGTVPDAYRLEQNYPNPFNPVSTIGYDLPAASRVSLKVYNILGQLVATLVDGIQQPGHKSAVWDGGKMASGVYVYRLEATAIGPAGKSYTQVRRMVLVK